MGTDADPSRRALRFVGVAMAGLFLLVALANLLWVVPVPTASSQSRMPPTASPFPFFNRTGPILHVVRMDADANLSTRLLLTSLQGIVNRVQVELYLDVGDPRWNLTEMLANWQARFGIAYDFVSAQTALDVYARRANGTIVYDPSRPESVNIGTMMAAQRGALLVGPDLAPWIEGTQALPVLFDYATSDWTALDAIGAYDRGMRELYPASSATLFAILPPNRWAIRDYLVATETFVFYLPQGALASPFESAATLRILHATPRGIPVLGWFDSPTLTEENAFVQMVSREGKFVVGAENVTNLSVLTALGRGQPHRPLPAPPSGPLENKTYVVLAVPDGDNLDFVAGRMRELWSESVRGTLPIAWSLNPLLVDLAPPLLDAYYQDATPLDGFVAAPSGAGYLYPDFTGPGDLPSYVAFANRYLNSSGMDVAWLLNAFPASEIPYTSESLSTYVDGLRLRGIVVDYADQPRSRDAWMQIGTQAVAPVVRSTHFWTTEDNVLAKVGAAAATWERGPHFLWLTVYSFRFNLEDAQGLVRLLDSRLPGGVEVVTPGAFFDLLRRDFVRQAFQQVGSAETDLLASIVFRGSLESAKRHLLDAQAFGGTGDSDHAAASAFLALENVRDLRSEEALLLSLLVLLGAGLLAVRAHRTVPVTPASDGSVHVATLLFLTAAIGLFVFALREAVEQNFWTYPTIVIGFVFAGLHRPLRQVLDRAYGTRAPAIAALLGLIFVTLAIRSTAAFPLAFVGTLLAIDTYLVRRPATPPEILAGISFGVAIGFVGDFDYVTLTGLALVFVATAVRLRRSPIEERRTTQPRPLVPGIILTLHLSALAIGFSYSLALRLEVQGDRLITVAAGVLVLASTLGVLVHRFAYRVPRHLRTGVALALAAAFGGAVLASKGTVLTTLALLGLFGSASFAAIAALEDHRSIGGDTRRPLKFALWLLPLLVLFFRMPPIVYSLTLIHLPEPVEYALYAPTVIIAATSLALVVLLALRGRLGTKVGNHYPREGDGRTSRP